PEVEIRLAAGDATAADFRILKIATEAAMGYSSEVVDQLWGFWHERAQRVGMQPYVAYLNGTPAGTISVWARGPFAWIDDVATHPDFRLRGKVALVAAASQGLGRAAAFAFAREGCKVAICARNATTLEDTANAMRKETKADVVAITADISRADGVKAFADGALRTFGGVDVLVPNAGGPPPGGFEALADDQWAKGWELTFQSTVRLVRACLPSMRNRGGGAVVAILSMSVRQPIDNLVLATSSCLGVVGALKTLAREVAKDRI